MEKENKNQDINKMATFENAKKCLENAERLYDDSKLVSNPTKLALMEIAIEELAKGLILYIRSEPNKTSEFAERAIDDRTIDLLHSGENKGFHEAIYKLTSTNVNLTNHQNKLELLQRTLDVIKSYYDLMREIFTKNPNTLEIVGSALGKENVEISKDLHGKFPDINAKEMVQIKESGFYVDFRGNKAITPSEANLKDVDKINLLFETFSKILKIVIG